MNTILSIMITLAFANETKSEIGFQYGFLGKLQAQPDTNTILEDSAVVQSNDEIRVNAGYLKDSYFYCIYLGSQGEYMLLYPDPSEVIPKEQVQPDTIHTTVLHWAPLTEPPGDETFYLINTLEPQNALIKMLTRYENAPEKGRVKLAKKIQDQLDKLNPDVKEKLASISSRLDKPLIGGVAFRGEDGDELKDLSLTHTCQGTGGIAFKKIVLHHK